MATTMAAANKAGKSAVQKTAPRPRVKFPKRFYSWCLLKSLTQLTASFLSISFISQSNFFIPGYYDASVWSVEAVRSIYILQAAFEVLDFVFEMWMLRKQTTGNHLPWDSIIHHAVSAAYAIYICLFADTLDIGFLGLAVTALACQVIGPLYTLHRLRLRFRALPIMILVVQVVWRIPLAVVSVIRAIQFFMVAPWAHFFICVVLAVLDYRWTIWAYKLFCKTEADYRAKRRAQLAGTNATIAKEAQPIEESMMTTAQMASQHLKAL
mmetsp:Transcript_5148/g.9259  ORF Transcript_5148/g.9259 Transcript_5148/m.9259 type:complete len:267 (-) Transcript_5148:173-973(-)|eukprot:CAMPEP_0184519492 /NCGR_PEP_ID=MMETSP0198_2-20121128/6658_1 /TAXON_ID=1112570 /ORGANISM="Thraustochytrium sp., Strain LLF1b" /LENGTH=266 /DNA_ID=CAMNT_0026910017 /DNA_START=415 /DNA_END=1215 /DNA_ORIENTATION=+